MKEQIYNIINERYLKAKPTIFTTNLSLSTIQNENETRSNQKSFGLNYQKVGKELMSQDEITVMDGVFSKGEMQKLSLARAINKDGDIFILDEVDSFSDEQYKSKLSRIIEELRYEKIIFIVTHNREVLSIADKTYRICEAKITLNNQKT